MIRRSVIAMGIAPMLLAAGTATPDPARILAGRYMHVWDEGGFYAGRREDIVEIMQIAPRTAYVRAHIGFGRGGYCGIYGIARAEGHALVYRDIREPLMRDHSRCVLAVKRLGSNLVLDDGETRGCHIRYCGVSGGFVDVKLPYASKRSIRYLHVVKASKEYREAMTEWRTGKPVRP